MNTCAVLRCQDPSTNTFVLQKEPLREVAVCARHLARLQAGEQWMLDADSGVLMDSDVPPTVVDYHLSSLLGSQRGVSLNLELSTPEGPRSQTVWLSSENADGLGDLLTNRLIR